MSQELNGTLTNSADLIGNISIGSESGTDNYNDLINKPSINSVTLQGNKTTSDLLIDYNDLLNKPTIPAAQVNSDWNATSGVAEILNKPTIINYGSELPMSSTDSNKVTDVINSICELPTVKSVSGVIATFDTDLTENIVKCIVDNSATKLVNISGNVTNLDLYIRNIYLGTYGFVHLGDLAWTLSVVGNNRKRFNGGALTNVKAPATNGDKVNGICSTYEIQSANYLYSTSGAVGLDVEMYGNLQVYDDNYADAAAFKTAMNGKYLIYELANPITPTITQTDLTNICTSFNVSGVVADLPTKKYPNTYNGTNNVFTDYNNVDVTYLETIGKAISE